MCARVFQREVPFPFAGAASYKLSLRESVSTFFFLFFFSSCVSLHSVADRTRNKNEIKTIMVGCRADLGKITQVCSDVGSGVCLPARRV